MSVEAQVSSVEWLERAAVALPGGASTMYDVPSDVGLVLGHGEGAVVTSVDGRVWTDYLLGSGPMVLGHSHSTVVEAVRRQAELGFTFYVTNSLAVELAEEVNRAVACAEQTKFTSSGSHATMYAIRLARAATGRDLVVRLEGGYHGSHDYAVLSTAPGASDPFRVQPDSAGVPRAVRETVVVAPFNSVSALERVLAEHQGRVAAVLMEPHERGIRPQPGYLEAVRSLAHSAGALLIFDEVVTGFRLAYGGAQERYGVVPDMCTLGKILGGGLPLAAVCGPREIMRLADYSYRKADAIFWNGTLDGNPLSAAAGLATLAVLRESGTYERLFEAGRRLRAGVGDVLQRRGVPGQVIGEGPMFHLVFGSEPVTDYAGTLAADLDRGRRVAEAMIRRGQLLSDTRNYISLAHTDEQIDTTIAVFDEVLAQDSTD